jgi:sortase A
VNAAQAPVKERDDPVASPSTERAPRTWNPIRRARQRPDRPPLPDTSVATIWVLGGMAALAAWFLFYALVLSGLQENRSQTLLYAQLREQLALGTAPVQGSIPYGSPVALITVAGAGITNAVVVEGTTSAQLADGPGHLSDTPLPGEQGVSVIFGRSTTYGRPFNGIRGLGPHDTISVTTSLGVFTYRVTDVRYPGDPLPAPLPAGGARLVLVTSYASGWRSGWAPDQTVLVDATLQGKANPTGATPSAVPTAALPMQGLSAALFPLVLWLQALVLVAVGVVWGRRRWGGWKTWLVGMPLLLAVLWGATESAMLLLPNLI